LGELRGKKVRKHKRGKLERTGPEKMSMFTFFFCTGDDGKALQNDQIRSF
jgi:hypothetical protein